ncbi:MAG: hypothetical protein H7A09_07305 [Oceanospirillaceae bacterium]|nr:hypothetical protein [Oceanospirillaceae bacterium]
MIPNLSKEMIDIMQQLRKRMRAEFGVDLRLSQTDIVEQLQVMALKSRDTKTRHLFAELDRHMGGIAPVVEIKPVQIPAAPQKPVRIYRGHAVA